MKETSEPPYMPQPGNESHTDWEKRLAGEGMPAELPKDPGISEGLDEEHDTIDKAAQAYVRERSDAGDQNYHVWDHSAFAGQLARQFRVERATAERYIESAFAAQVRRYKAHRDRGDQRRAG